MRAVLALLWCEAICGEYARAAAIAAAYELAHGAALVQDDVIDHSPLRRGEPSIPGKYGVSGAILASNTLLFYVPKLIAEFGRKSGDAILVSRLLELFGECYRSSTLGEYFDLEMAGSTSTISEADYERMIRLKTGSLIGAASASGALIGRGAVDEDLLCAAYQYGESLGIAYQIQDDILDIFGDEKTIGKPIFNDLAGGKKSLMIIRLLQQCDSDEREFVNQNVSRRKKSFGEDEILRTRSLLKKYDCEAYAKEFASRYIRRAESSLSGLGNSKARKRLSELSYYLAARNY